MANVRRTELVFHQARIDRHVEHARLLLDELHSRGVDDINIELDQLQAGMNETLQATIRAKLSTASKSSMYVCPVSFVIRFCKLPQRSTQFVPRPFLVLVSTALISTVEFTQFNWNLIPNHFVWCNLAGFGH